MIKEERSNFISSRETGGFYRERESPRNARSFSFESPKRTMSKRNLEEVCKEGSFKGTYSDTLYYLMHSYEYSWITNELVSI